MRSSERWMSSSDVTVVSCRFAVLIVERVARAGSAVRVTIRKTVPFSGAGSWLYGPGTLPAFKPDEHHACEDLAARWPSALAVPPAA